MYVCICIYQGRELSRPCFLHHQIQNVSDTIGESLKVFDDAIEGEGISASACNDSPPPPANDSTSDSTLKEAMAPPMSRKFLVMKILVALYSNPTEDCSTKLPLKRDIALRVCIYIRKIAQWGLPTHGYLDKCATVLTWHVGDLLHQVTIRLATSKDSFFFVKILFFFLYNFDFFFCPSGMVIPTNRR